MIFSLDKLHYCDCCALFQQTLQGVHPFFFFCWKRNVIDILLKEQAVINHYFLVFYGIFGIYSLTFINQSINTCMIVYVYIFECIYVCMYVYVFDNVKFNIVQLFLVLLTYFYILTYRKQISFANGIHTYIIGHYNPSVRITTYVLTIIILCALIFYLHT